MMKHLVLSVMLLCGLLVGCGNSVDSTIEEAKLDMSYDGMTYEERFDEVIAMLEFQGDVTGYSREDEVIVLKSNIIDATLEERYEGSVGFAQRILDRYDMYDVVVLYEYYIDNERVAVAEITIRDSDLILD